MTTIVRSYIFLSLANRIINSVAVTAFSASRQMNVRLSMKTLRIPLWAAISML